MATESELQTLFEWMGSKFTRGHVNHTVECPLARWTHREGKDKHPSARVKAGEPSVFMCFSCRTKGTVTTIAWLYNERSGDRKPYEYIRNIEKSGNDLNRKVDYDECVSRAFSKYKNYEEKKSVVKKDEITEERLQEYKQKCPKYALTRMTKGEIVKYEIGYKSDEKRMVFPIRDVNQKLVGFSGRALEEEQRPKYRHATGFKKEYVFYGEQWLDQSNRTGYGVEGFFDVINMHRFNLKNVMACMGASYSQYQIEKVKKWFGVFIFLPDFDDSGKQGLRLAEEEGRKLYMLGVRVGIAGVVPNELYVNRIKDGEWHDCDFKYRPIPELVGKDPGNWNLKDITLAFKHIEWFKL